MSESSEQTTAVQASQRTVDRAHSALSTIAAMIEAIEDAADSADQPFPSDVELPRVELLTTIDMARDALNSQKGHIKHLNAQLAVRAEVERAIADHDARKLLAQFIYGLTRQIQETLEMVESDFRKAGARAVWGARGRDIMPQAAALMTVAELLAKDAPDFHDAARMIAAQRIEELAAEMAAAASKQITRAIERAAITAAAKFAEDGE